MKRRILWKLAWCLAAAGLGSPTGRAAEWAVAKAPLMTRWAAEVNPTNAWPEYPRPQLSRPDWISLNGLWGYAVVQEPATTPPPCSGQILVPYPLESALSGAAKHLDVQDRLWYQREFTAPSSWHQRRVRLNFGAVDWQCRVWVNDQYIGEHQGGYDAFSFDITQALKWGVPEKVVLCVSDPTEGEQPRGKQSHKPEAVFYTSTSGIWQTVWLEPVPEVCIDGLKLVPDVDAQGLSWLARVGSQVADLEVEAVASVAGRPVARMAGRPNSPLFIPLPRPHLWRPEDPFLYDLQVTLKRAGREVDKVESYFGMRKVALKRDSLGRMGIALNDELIFQTGVLDQGFWPDGIYTAPSDAALRHDLEFLKGAGFNLVRKHLKIEPQRWYYWCDRLGLLVWQDMPSAENISANARLNFEVELRRMVDALYNHPSIVQWVLFNNGWGEYDTERLTAHLKRWDPSRLVDSCAGQAHVGDVIDVRSYPEPPTSGEPSTQRASVLGEFGGIGFHVDGHTWLAKSWGYENAQMAEGISAWYLHLMRMVWLLKQEGGYCASVYTQLTDIESECNGLMTYDRKVAKLDPSVLKLANREPAAVTQPNIVLANALNGDTIWRYTFEEPSPGWQQPGFDAALWREGHGGFGAKSSHGLKPRTAWESDGIWLRCQLVLSSNDFKHLKLELSYNDSVEVFFNGVLAFEGRSPLIDYWCFDPSPEAARALRPGTNVIAAHCKKKRDGQFFDVGIYKPD